MAIRWKAGRETERTWPDGWDKPSVEIPRPTYEGLVVGRGVHNSVRVMSDVWEDVHYALVWSEADNAVKEVEYFTTGWPSNAVVEIDASAEVFAKAKAWFEARERERLLAEHDAAVWRHVEVANRIEHGKDVEVVRGRKVPKGSKGRVFWMGESRFGPRVGIELVSGERVFTARGNVEVSNPDEFIDLDWAMAVPDVSREAAEAAAARMREIGGLPKAA